MLMHCLQNGLLYNFDEFSVETDRFCWEKEISKKNFENNAAETA